MFYRYLLILVTTVFIFSLYAGETYTISGRVVDQVTQQPLAHSNITVLNTSMGTTSDDDGFFIIKNLPPAYYVLEVGYIGYSIKKYEIPFLSADTVLQIELNQSAIDGPLVIVESNQAQERINPVTFNNIDRKTLQSRYTVQDIPEILSELPSTTFYSENGNGIGYNYLSIRGFDQRRISVMINGIPQNDPEDHNIYWLDFPDFASNIQSIQVQRGAGSSFYGPAAIGGSINIQTNYFNPEPQLDLQAGFGSYGTRKISASLNSGMIADKYIINGRVSRIKSDGYRDRAWVDFKSYFLGAAMYTQKHHLRFHFFGGPIEDGLAYEGLPKLVNENSKLRQKNYSYWELNASADSILYAAERRKDEIENFNQPHFELLYDYRISPQATLKNNLFFILGYGFFDYDGSWGDPEYFRLTPEFGYSVDSIPSDALIRAYVNNKQLGWLPQLTVESDWGQFTLGGEFRAHRSLHWGRLQKGTGLSDNIVGNNARHYYEYKGAKLIASVYYHQVYKYRKNINLTSDLQYAYKRYKLYDEKFLNNDFEIPYHFLNPRIGINYNINSNLHTYLSVSNTTREPRLKNFYDAAEASTPESWGPIVPQFELNSDSSFNFDKPLVKPETLTGLELGVGYHSNAFHGTVNLYLMNFKNEIIKKGGVDRFGQPITGNAERTLHQGVEVSGRLQVLPQISLSGNMSYSRNELVDYTVYDYDNSITLDGNRIAGFPDLISNLRLTYNWLGTYAALDMGYSGKYYTDNFENEQNTVDAYTVFNLSLRQELSLIGLRGVAVQLKINNLLDKKYLSHGEGDAFFPAATRNWFVNLQYKL
ncbi:MAG: TonB-dependent receptor [Calditrichaceae bacterium]